MGASVLNPQRPLRELERLRDDLSCRRFSVSSSPTETERILSDPALMLAIEMSDAEVEMGDTVPAEEAHEKLGW